MLARYMPVLYMYEEGSASCATHQFRQIS